MRPARPRCMLTPNHPMPSRGRQSRNEEASMDIAEQIAAIDHGRGRYANEERRPMGDEVVPDRILDLSFAFFGSKTLLSAVELGLFAELASGPLEAETLRQRLGLHPRASRDFFDALVALGLLARQDGQYR